MGAAVGWIQCSTEEQARDLWGLGFMRSGSSPCHFAACLVTHLLQPLEVSEDDSGAGAGAGAASFRCLLDAQVSSLCTTYASKYETLTSALLEYSSQLLAGAAGGALHIEGYHHPDRRVGGYFVWVRLPAWCHPGEAPSHSHADSPFLQAARAAHLTVRSGQECTGNGTGNDDYIRLCFAR